MQLKVIFDKERENDRLESGWGISYLLEDTLFDTGENLEYLLTNMKILNVDLEAIKNIVISHNHWDHRGGLFGLLKIKKDLIIYGCSDFYEEFKNELKAYNFNRVDRFRGISKNIYTTGPFSCMYKDSPINEQSLIVKSPNGISIICACAHMGLIELIMEAKRLFENERINLIVGGFHLIDSDNRFIEYVAKEVKRIGVEKIGPSHCSGYEAAKMFEKLYGRNFVEVKTGLTLETK